MTGPSFSPAWSDGRTYGGAVYSRGALYQILNNRMYVGKIVHRGQVYPAQHMPIIEQKLWDQVARSLKTNDRAKRTTGTRGTSSLLTGLLRDTDGVRFTPTHAVKKGKRYRYYTSQAVIQNNDGRPRIARYPAMDLEALVTAQIHQLLRSAPKYPTGNKKTREAELVLQRAKDLAVKWPDLATFDRNEFIRAVVKTITLGQKSLWIVVHRLQLVARLLGCSPAKVSGFDSRNPSVINLTADFQPIRRGVELRIHAPNDSPTNSRPIPALVKAVARAREWHEQLISGEVSSVEEIAQNSGFECRYVRKLLQSSALSPEICEAILSGRQAPHLTIRNLQSGLPLDWRQQAQKLIAAP